jgi:hypothetical protein
MALTQHSFTKTSGGKKKTPKRGGKLAQQMDKDPKDYDGGKLQQEPGIKDHHGDEPTDLHPPIGVSAGGKRKTGKNPRRAGKRRTQKKNKRSKTSKK